MAILHHEISTPEHPDEKHDEHDNGTVHGRVPVFKGDAKAGDVSRPLRRSYLPYFTKYRCGMVYQFRLLVLCRLRAGIFVCHRLQSVEGGIS
jgi:hypothetical protein